MTIAEVFLALHSSCETNPATRQGDSLQDSLRSLAALLLRCEGPGTIMQTDMKAHLGSQPGPRPSASPHPHAIHVQAAAEHADRHGLCFLTGQGPALPKLSGYFNPEPLGRWGAPCHPRSHSGTATETRHNSW